MPLSQSDSHTEIRGGTPGEGRLKKLLKVIFFLTENLFPPNMSRSLWSKW